MVSYPCTGCMNDRNHRYKFYTPAEASRGVCMCNYKYNRVPLVSRFPVLSVLLLEIFLILARRDVGILLEDADKILVVAESDILRDGIDLVVA